MGNNTLWEDAKYFFNPNNWGAIWNSNWFEGMEHFADQLGIGIDDIGRDIGISDADRIKLSYYAGQDPLLLGYTVRQKDNWNYVNDYMTNRNVDWSDVQYPTYLNGGGNSSGYTALRNTANFVSDNIKKLYDD